MRLDRDGDVFVLDFGAGENRIDPIFLGEFDDFLTTCEKSDTPRALVTTGSGRFYSNGFDLDHVQGLDPDGRDDIMAEFDQLLVRLTTAPMVTVAAINGHCYAAGALLALGHDYRVMQDNEGWFCLPSVDVQIPFSRTMTELITVKVPAPTAQSLVVSGDRMGGAACEGFGVVHDAVGADQVLPTAVALAARLADKDPSTLGTIKRRIYADVTAHLG